MIASLGKTEDRRQRSKPMTYKRTIVKGDRTRTIFRRAVLRSARLTLISAACRRRPPEARVVEVRHVFQEFHYRAPYKFGGREVDRTTLLDVTCRIRVADRETWEIRLDDDWEGFANRGLVATLGCRVCHGSYLHMGVIWDQGTDDRTKLQSQVVAR